MKKANSVQQQQLEDAEGRGQRLQERNKQLERQIAEMSAQMAELQVKANAPPVTVHVADPEIARQQQARIDALTTELAAIKKGATVTAAMTATLEAKDKALEVISTSKFLLVVSDPLFLAILLSRL